MQINSINGQGGIISGISSEVSKPNSQSSTDTLNGFQAVVQSLDVASSNPAAIKTAVLDNLRADGAGINSNLDKTAVSKAFETMLVAQFLSPLFAGSGASMFGSGVQGDITKSLLTDAIAEAITERGGIGLGKFI